MGVGGMGWDGIGWCQGVGLGGVMWGRPTGVMRLTLCRDSSAVLPAFSPWATCTSIWANSMFCTCTATHITSRQAAQQRGLLGDYPTHQLLQVVQLPICLVQE